MLFPRKALPLLCAILLFGALSSSPSYSQQDNQSNQAQQETTEGTIVSSSRTTFVVRSDDNQFHLFTTDRNTARPRTLPVGSRVRVNSEKSDRESARHATDVTVLDRASNTTSTSPNVSARDAAPVPPSIRNVERQAENEARRWRLGGRVGVGLDPELILFGVHSQMGPIFSRNVFFRPNADFEWGEVTDMVALNLEAVYRMPRNTRDGRWAPYFGAGPSLNFIHQSYQTQPGQGRDFSFGNFDYETGFNLLVGMQNRKGVFFEAKTSLYSQPAPVFRLIVGRTF